MEKSKFKLSWFDDLIKNEKVETFNFDRFVIYDFSLHISDIGGPQRS